MLRWRFHTLQFRAPDRASPALAAATISPNCIRHDTSWHAVTAPISITARRAHTAEPKSPCAPRLVTSAFVSKETLGGHAGMTKAAPLLLVCSGYAQAQAVSGSLSVMTMSDRTDYLGWAAWRATDSPAASLTLPVALSTLRTTLADRRQYPLQCTQLPLRAFSRSAADWRVPARSHVAQCTPGSSFSLP